MVLRVWGTSRILIERWVLSWRSSSSKWFGAHPGTGWWQEQWIVPFSSLLDRVPCELHKQYLSDTRDRRQNFNRHSALTPSPPPSLTWVNIALLKPPSLPRLWWLAVGRSYIGDSTGLELLMTFQECSLTSVDLDFHEPCVSIYACLLSLYTLWLSQSISIIFPSLLHIFTLTNNYKFHEKEVCKINIIKKQTGNIRYQIWFLLEYLKFLASLEFLPTVRPWWKVYVKKTKQNKKLGFGTGV